MKQPMICGIIFDKDGTLFDFQRTWTGWARRLMQHLAAGDRSLAARLGHAVGFDAEAGFAPDSPVIAGTTAEVAALLAPHLPGQDDQALVAVMNTLAASADLAPTVPLRPLLTDLRGRGLRLGVATNDTLAPTRAHLAEASISDLFDAVHASDGGLRPKPAPDMLLAFAQGCGLMPAQVAMVGDSLHDLHAGRAAGMICIGVLTGPAPRAALAPHADVVLPDIGALPEWLADRPLGRLAASGR